MASSRFVLARRRWLLAVAALALPILAWGADVAESLAAPGPYAVRVVEDEWRDAASGRTVPVKLYVPDDSAGRNLPAVLFSHGLGGSRDGGAMWGRHWASHGLVSIHLQHPGSDEGLWRDRMSAGDRAGVRDAMKGGVSVRSALSRVADVKFALDEIARRADAGDAVVARIDRSRIGMSGHSFGAWTTLAVSGAGFAMGAVEFPRTAAARRDRVQPVRATARRELAGKVRHHHNAVPVDHRDARRRCAGARHDAGESNAALPLHAAAGQVPARP